MAETKDKLLKRRQVAELLSYSIRSVQRLEVAGKLQAVKLSPRCTCYRRSDVYKLMGVN